MYYFENSCSWEINAEIFMDKGTRCQQSALQGFRKKEQMEQNTNNQ